MTALPAPARVDWSTWASHAAALTCPACERTFAPNHPRRRFCGRADCPGRTRRRVCHDTTDATLRPPRARRQTNTLYGLLGDALLRAHTRNVPASPLNLAAAAIELAYAVKAGCSPADEAEQLTNLLAIAARRAASVHGGSPS